MGASLETLRSVGAAANLIAVGIPLLVTILNQGLELSHRLNSAPLRLTLDHRERSRRLGGNSFSIPDHQLTDIHLAQS